MTSFNVRKKLKILILLVYNSIAKMDMDIIA